MAPNEIYQYSLANALMDGVADHGLPLATLLAHGDHGLGTFRHMVGEMILLDGTMYQMKSDGSVVTVHPLSQTDTKTDKAKNKDDDDDDDDDDTQISPFAMVTHFVPTHTTTAVLADKADLAGLLSVLLPDAHNLYLAVRLTGTFHRITVRTVGGQRQPHEGLAAVGTHQTSQTFPADDDDHHHQKGQGEGIDGIEGTIVGFRSPAYMQGISVAGDHLHFVSADRTRGGHLLALVSRGEVTVEVAPIAKFHLELPVQDDEFNEASLVGDDAGIQAVEG